MKRFLAPATIAAAALIAISPRSARADLVANGGFETGDFTGWTLSGNLAATGVSTNIAHGGMYAAYLGPVGSDGTLSQDLSTIAGDTYSISFWVKHGLSNQPRSPLIAEFGASWNGSQILYDSNVTGDKIHLNYTEYTFTEVATGATTDLSFTYREDPSFYYLDDISVNDLGAAGKVPDIASSSLLLGLGLGGLGALRRKLS